MCSSDLRLYDDNLNIQSYLVLLHYIFLSCANMEQEIAMSNSKTLNCLIFLQSFLLINTIIFANIPILFKSSGTELLVVTF